MAVKQTNHDIRVWMIAGLFSVAIFGTTTFLPLPAHAETPPSPAKSTSTTTDESSSTTTLTNKPTDTDTSTTTSSTEPSQADSSTAAKSNDGGATSKQSTSALSASNSNNISDTATGTITFQFKNQTNQSDITVDGAKTNVGQIQKDGNISSYTISTDASDPTQTKITNKAAYVPEIPGYKFVGNIDDVVPDQFGVGNYTYSFEYLPLANIEVSYVDLADPKQLLWQYTIPSTNAFEDDAYSTNYSQLPFNGYTYASSSGPVSGVFSQTDLTNGQQPVQVTYYYQKKQVRKHPKITWPMNL